MLADDDPDNWDRVQDVNLKGVFLGIKYGAPAIVDSGGGSILNWGSIGGIISSGMSPGYSASKAGVISLTKNAAIQYSPLGVRVNCILPGFVLTPMIGKGRPRRLTRGPRADAQDHAGQGAPRAGDDGGGDRRGRPLAVLAGGRIHHRRRPAGRRWLVHPLGLSDREDGEPSATFRDYDIGAGGSIGEPADA